MRSDEPQALLRRTGLPPDPKIRLLLQDHPKAGPDQFMVVDQNNVNHLEPSLGRLF